MRLIFTIEKKKTIEGEEDQYGIPPSRNRCVKMFNLSRLLPNNVFRKRLADPAESGIPRQHRSLGLFLSNLKHGPSNPSDWCNILR